MVKAFTSLIDKDFDDYEVGYSFVVEEPFRAKQSKPRLGSDSEVYWSTINEIDSQIENYEYHMRRSLCIGA